MDRLPAVLHLKNATPFRSADMENVIILGSGPAGLTAALYAARANLNPLVVAGPYLGGQIATTTDVENFPGFPEGLTGPELTELMQKQAERFGARVEFDSIVSVDFKQSPFRLTGNMAEYEAQAVIIATGASPRTLGVPGEKELTGRGVSYCATCDGFFFKNKELMAVGGGDSALQEALFLTKFASKVQIVHRRDALRAGHVLQERARKNEKISFIWNSVITEIHGEGAVKSVRMKNVQTGEETVKPVDGVFVYVGHIPNTAIFKGQLAIDEEGYLIVDSKLHTSLPGVFAAGEAHDRWFRQAIVSSGYGCMAAMETEKYLASLE
jgi:thioredoxin reductase (NADPH)